MKHSDRSVSYSRIMDERPSEEQVREAEAQMRRHMTTACLQAGYPIHGFLDTQVRRTAKRRFTEARRWSITVTALIGHVC